MGAQPLRLIGIDPGLRATGWGVIDVAGTRLGHVASGTVRSDGELELALRLMQLFEGLSAVIAELGPAEAAVEETFLNRNPGTTLRLGLARGAALLAPAHAGLPVAEYAAKVVKRSLVGTGSAEKSQVEAMVRTLLPGAAPDSADAADALAVAVCHAHHRGRAALVRLSEAARPIPARRAPARFRRSAPG